MKELTIKLRTSIMKVFYMNKHSGKKKKPSEKHHVSISLVKEISV